MVRAGHAGIGLIGCSARKHASIGSGDVGVRADHGGGAAIEIPAHGHFFAGQLGVKIDETDFGCAVELFEQLVCLAKGAIDVGHGSAALQIDDCIRNAVASSGGKGAFAGQPGRIVGGTKQARLVIHIIVDLAFIEAVIAASEDVQAKAEKLFGYEGRNAKAAGAVFGVGNGQIDFIFGDQVIQMIGDHSTPTRGEDITNKENVH